MPQGLHNALRRHVGTVNDNVKPAQDIRVVYWSKTGADNHILLRGYRPLNRVGCLHAVAEALELTHRVDEFTNLTRQLVDASS